ncbi:ScbA/BarX family gamma-butyrolactone biosynthesis protein [Streptomyces sp. NPDC005907]|uniref:ScbA/BarX family gamma-butyrolactone biosynthesis protein n=1 Tax=Streptomyces sp. NPDC005907 TaxID=3154571 RepID=UPI00340F0589
MSRSLVHRRALSEVFLTDSRTTDGTHFVAAAQLPPSHAYFTDHTTAAVVDPLLLLECCRQAETHAVHAHFGAPRNTKFVLKSWTLDLPEPADLPSGHGPTPLVLSVGTQDAQWSSGALRALTYRMRIEVDSRQVGEARMQVQYVPDAVYGTLRRRGRSGPVPTSDDFRAAAAGEPVAPARVGRTRPENVILLDARTEPDAVRARLRIAGDHPSLFDHAQDHVPGMVLMEAGRQAFLLAAEEFTGDPASSWCLVGLEASFGAYAELDAPLTVVGHRPTTVARAGGRAALGVRVTFEQAGRPVAEAAFTGVSTRGGQ